MVREEEVSFSCHCAKAKNKSTFPTSVTSRFDVKWTNCFRMDPHDPQDHPPSINDTFHWLDVPGVGPIPTRPHVSLPHSHSLVQDTQKNLTHNNTEQVSAAVIFHSAILVRLLLPSVTACQKPPIHHSSSFPCHFPILFHHDCLPKDKAS